MQNFEPLGLAWDGRGAESSVDLADSADRTKHLIPADILDDEMACGGRAALDRSILAKEKPARPCGTCAVREVCLLGEAQG